MVWGLQGTLENCKNLTRFRMRASVFLADMLPISAKLPLAVLPDDSLTAVCRSPCVLQLTARRQTALPCMLHDSFLPAFSHPDRSNHTCRGAPSCSVLRGSSFYKICQPHHQSVDSKTRLVISSVPCTLYWRSHIDLKLTVCRACRTTLPSQDNPEAGQSAS